MATEISRKLFTVEDYHRMLDAGILTKADRVELIRGEVLAMSPIGPPHNGAVIRATNLLVPITANYAIVSAQGAIRLSQYDEPQPDICLLRPREDFYSTRHPGPEDILLIIEIADSSLDFDRTTKANLYAETGIREYWVADIEQNCLWTYSGIHESAYRAVRQLARGQSLSPLLLPECRIPVDAVLP
jgi:Uma2 family endonuclease